MNRKDGIELTSFNPMVLNLSKSRNTEIGSLIVSDSWSCVADYNAVSYHFDRTVTFDRIIY